MFPYFFPLFFTREQRKLLTIRNWTLLGLHVQNSSIYTYIMTWVYCQLSLEDYSCHVTSRDMSCDQGKFSCEKKRLKKKNGNRIYNKNINIGTEHYCCQISWVHVHLSISHEIQKSFCYWMPIQCSFQKDNCRFS